MKNLSIKKIQEVTGLSYWFAFEIVYSDILNSKKFYINRGTYAIYTLDALATKFRCTFEFGNDAPRGGKRGRYAIITSYNEKFIQLKDMMNALDVQIGEEIFQYKKERSEAVNNMIISEQDAANFLSKIEGLSNKKSRKVAHNCAAKQLGFYSIDGMQKFMDLKK